MKELMMKKRSELEEICKMTLIELDTMTAAEISNALIDSGLSDPSKLFPSIESQIIKVKDIVLSRKYILDTLDRWISVCKEEKWLEEYSQDDNRYNAGRGAAINLKHAERPRVTVSKIPGVVDNMINRTLEWEEEKKTFFLYYRARLLYDYKLTRLQREEGKKRYRDQKKSQDLLLTEKEAIYESKPSPRKYNSFRMPNGYQANGNRSMTSTSHQNLIVSRTPESLTPQSYSSCQNGQFKEVRRLSTAPCTHLFEVLSHGLPQ